MTAFYVFIGKSFCLWLQDRKTIRYRYSMTKGNIASCHFRLLLKDCVEILGVCDTELKLKYFGLKVDEDIKF